MQIESRLVPIGTWYLGLLIICNKHQDVYKRLVFTLDQHLDYTLHFKENCRQLNYGLKIIRQVRSFLPQEAFASLANFIFLSHLDFCSPLLRNISKAPLIVLQKICMCHIFLQSTMKKQGSFHKPDWLPLHQGIEFNSSILMYKVINGMTLPYFSSIFSSTLSKFIVGVETAYLTIALQTIVLRPIVSFLIQLLSRN